ncbi:hypothetical protein [Rhodococcoides kyotonense]|uniref:Uncharacterized protein n=1 Tax=Rhodococcoides kyotonense TaxID=398843 RepID=A0A239FRD3_9NOCA|nr:hypothetical protein [Rhodococcus kyotonensis]SNS59517.1 hypothetical protein SAMN05421642_103424 [Rhodococcus kyotonensis]
MNGQAGYMYLDRDNFVEITKETWSLNDAADAALEHVARTRIPVIVVWRNSPEDRWQEIDAATEHAMTGLRS